MSHYSLGLIDSGDHIAAMLHWSMFAQLQFERLVNEPVAASRACTAYLAGGCSCYACHIRCSAVASNAPAVTTAELTNVA
jgi:hypothetical protein